MDVLVTVAPREYVAAPPKLNGRSLDIDSPLKRSYLGGKFSSLHRLRRRRAPARFPPRPCQTKNLLANLYSLLTGYQYRRSGMFAPSRFVWPLKNAASLPSRRRAGLNPNLAAAVAD